MSKGFVDFGDVARGQLSMQCQYASRYIRGRERGYIRGRERDGTPALGEGLRFDRLDTGCYHDILIHKDDVAEFVRRFKEYKQNVGWIG